MEEKVFVNLGKVTEEAIGSEITIGKFIIVFSTLEQLIRMYLCVYLKIPIYAQGTFFAQMTFSSLCNLLQKVAYAELPVDKAKTVVSLLNKIKTFHDNERNLVVHGSWTYSGANLLNRFQSRNSQKPTNYVEYTPEQILAWVDKIISFEEDLVALFQESLDKKLVSVVPASENI